MLSANAIGDVNAHHRIRHRARHSLRGGVASPLQRFAPVVPRRRPRRPRMSRAGQARHVSCKYPALPARPERLRLGTTHSVVGGSRLPCGTCTAPIPIACASGGQAGCLHLLPQALSGTSHRPSIPPQAGKRHALSVTHPMALPSSFHPQQHPVFSSSSAPPAQTHPHTRFLNIHTRAKTGVRARRGPVFMWSHPPLTRPRSIPRAPSSELGKRTPDAAPREAARCRPVSRADRLATPYGHCEPDTPSAVSACRRFLDQEPTTLDSPA
jgi:hypothetical protein